MRFIDLVDRGSPFTRAALEADFGSYAQCHRIFRRTLRCSPQAYFAGARTQLNDETALPLGDCVIDVRGSLGASAAGKRVLSQLRR